MMMSAGGEGPAASRGMRQNPKMLARKRMVHCCLSLGTVFLHRTLQWMPMALRMLTPKSTPIVRVLACRSRLVLLWVAQ